MPFLEEPQPSGESFWRAIMLFGQNVASYKFALGRALLDVAEQGTSFITLDDLALPYAKQIVTHIAGAAKQATSPSSRFLDACAAYSRGELSDDQLRAETVRRGFPNVIDAFHVVNRAPLPVRFFVDERRTRRGMTLTDDLLRLTEGVQFANLPHEVEARWKLVEAAWALDIAVNLLQVRYDAAGEALYVPRPAGRRIGLTSSRAALNGYQKGKCFYCFADISIAPSDPALADVDHCFPHTLLTVEPTWNLNGVWNLVLACQRCNRGDDGKFARVPAPHLVERLHRRNTYFVESHHPLRETIMAQTGAREEQRAAFLQRTYTAARAHLVHTWAPREERGSGF